MERKNWEKKGKEMIHRNPWWAYERHDFIGPEGDEIEYYIVDASSFVLMVPVNEEGKIGIVEQYRPAIDRVSMELPAGGIEPGETVEQAVQRELAEEVHCVAETVEPLGDFYTSGGFTNEQAKMFLVTDLQKSVRETEEHEYIEIFWKTPEEVDRMIEDGQMVDASHVLAWKLARKHVDALLENR